MTPETYILIERLQQVIKEIIEEATDTKASMIGDDVLLFPDMAAEFGLEDPSVLGLELDPEISLDSLDILDIMVGIEDTFGIEYDINDLQTGEISPLSLASPRLIAQFIIETIDPAIVAEGIQKWGGRR